jgi:hypothetical protein
MAGRYGADAEQSARRRRVAPRRNEERNELRDAINGWTSRKA